MASRRPLFGMWIGTVALIAGPSASVAQSAKPIAITIDVKPGDSPTTVEPGRGGLIPVAILSSARFDATTIDPATILVGRTGTEASPFRTTTDDVDRDGRADLVALVRVQEMKLQCSDTSIKLTAKTAAGASVEGSETVTMQCG